MNKSEKIHSLASAGLAVAEIARQVGVRYQFARNVLLRANMLKKAALRTGGPKSTLTTKPELHADRLVEAGFSHSGKWLIADNGELALERRLPKEPGVYCLARNGRVLYVGLATMGLAKRLYFYAKPGKTQLTSRRINKLLRKHLRAGETVDLYTVSPPNLEWKGLLVSGMAGLELGMIEAFDLPWNIRGAKKSGYVPDF